VIATGPDGALWAASALAERLVRLMPDGPQSFTRFDVPSCPAPVYADMERASDGAMWIADIGCGRLIRIAPGGTPATFRIGAEASPGRLAADAAGGVWFAETREPVVGHVDSGGRVTRVQVRHGRTPTDVAVAPDGSAWFAFRRCALGRLTAGGTLALLPAPIPVKRLAFDPAGGLWLASETRLVRTSTPELGGACDDRRPRVRMRPAGGRVSLDALRDGFGSRSASRP
jgi:streptogramin lyase